MRRSPKEEFEAKKSENEELEDSAAGRALAILDLVALNEDPANASDLSAKLNLPHATVHRLTVRLERLGYLRREPGTKRFLVGPRLEVTALNTLINSSRRGERHTILQSLVREIGETCNITALDGNEVVYIDRVEADWPLRTHFQPGSRVPIHCTASGLLFLSMMPARKRRRLLTAAPLPRYTERTCTAPSGIEKELKKIRKAQAAVEAEGFLPGLIGVAVPIYDSKKRMCATVGMHAPTARFNVEEAKACIPVLSRAAAAIARTLDPRLKQ